MVFIATVLLANRLSIKINKNRDRIGENVDGLNKSSMGGLPGKACSAYYRCSNLTAPSVAVWSILLTICEFIEGRVNRTWESLGPASQKTGSLTHLKVARVVADQVAERHNTNDLARFCHD